MAHRHVSLRLRQAACLSMSMGGEVVWGASTSRGEEAAWGATTRGHRRGVEVEAEVGAGADVGGGTVEAHLINNSSSSSSSSWVVVSGQSG